jgi:hypothetical protein
MKHEAALLKFMQVANQYPSTERRHRGAPFSRVGVVTALDGLRKPCRAIRKSWTARAPAASTAGWRNSAAIEARVLVQAMTRPSPGAGVGERQRREYPAARCHVDGAGPRSHSPPAKKTEAKQTFDQVLKEFPDSVADKPKSLLASVT